MSGSDWLGLSRRDRELPVLQVVVDLGLAASLGGDLLALVSPVHDDFQAVRAGPLVSVAEDA